MVNTNGSVPLGQIVLQQSGKIELVKGFKVKTVFSY